MKRHECLCFLHVCVLFFILLGWAVERDAGRRDAWRMGKVCMCACWGGYLVASAASH